MEVEEKQDQGVLIEREAEEKEDVLIGKVEEKQDQVVLIGGEMEEKEDVLMGEVEGVTIADGFRTMPKGYLSYYILIQTL